MSKPINETLEEFAERIVKKAEKADLSEQIEAFKALTSFYAAQQKAAGKQKPVPTSQDASFADFAKDLGDGDEAPN